MWAPSVHLCTVQPSFDIVPVLWSQHHGPFAMVPALWSLCYGPSACLLPPSTPHPTIKPHLDLVFIVSFFTLISMLNPLSATHSLPIHPHPIAPKPQCNSAHSNPTPKPHLDLVFPTPMATHPSPLIFTLFHHYTSLHATTCHYTPLCTTMHHYTPLHTPTCHYMPLHTTTHHYAPLCTPTLH